MLDLTYFHFLRPGWLVILLLVASLEWHLWVRGRRPSTFENIIDPELLKHLREDRSATRVFTPEWLRIPLLILLVLILAGPTWRQQPSPLAEDTAAVVIVLDVSPSMDSIDIAPSRLERAKQKMLDLLEAHPEKAMAIIVYGGSAHTVLPLTKDHDILKNYLVSLSTQVVPEPGKFAEYALPSIDAILRQQRQAASILLVTDGLGAGTTSQWGAWCDQSPHNVLVYGVGSQSADNGSVALDTRALKALANRCNGHFYTVQIDTSDIAQMASAMSDAYQIIDDTTLPWLDEGYGLIFPALLLSVLWFRRGWVGLWVWFLVLPLSWSDIQRAEAQVAKDPATVIRPVEPLNPTQEANAAPLINRLIDGFAQLWLTPDQYGWVLLQLGAYDRAGTVFASSQWQGIAAYYAGDFRRAALLFSRSAHPDSLFNEANARAQERDYIGAIKRYDALLKRVPEFTIAAENRDRVQALVDEINRLSASQPDEAGVGSETLDAETDPQPAEGEERAPLDREARQQFTAEQLLASPEATALWLKAVQQDPALFLRTKFRLQREERGVSEP